MKKNILIMLMGIAAFVAGFECNNWYCNNEALHEANNFKRELITAQYRALEEANSLIDKHNLWDADGSDLMDNYLNSISKVDSLYKTQE